MGAQSKDSSVSFADLLQSDLSSSISGCLVHGEIVVYETRTDLNHTGDGHRKIRV